MIYTGIDQGTPEWHQLRCGKVTASNASDVKAKSRDGKTEGLTRKKYRTRIVVEWLTGKPASSSFKSEAMENGNEMEPIARAAYENHTQQFVDQITFATHDDIEHYGASPDGLVGTDGLVEIKCPMAHTHYDYITENRVPPEYIDQMIAQCSVLKRKWVDFVSYNDNFPSHMRLFIVRFTPTEDQIKSFESEVIKFLNEAKEEFSKWQK